MSTCTAIGTVSLDSMQPKGLYTATIVIGRPIKGAGAVTVLLLRCSFTQPIISTFDTGMATGTDLLTLILQNRLYSAREGV